MSVCPLLLFWKLLGLFPGKPRALGLSVLPFSCFSWKHYKLLWCYIDSLSFLNQSLYVRQIKILTKSLLPLPAFHSTIDWAKYRISLIHFITARCVCLLWTKATGNGKRAEDLFLEMGIILATIESIAWISNLICSKGQCNVNANRRCSHFNGGLPKRQLT